MIIILILMGLCSGILAGLLGIGGGVLFLPAAAIYFIDYLKHDPEFIKVIIATSSMMIVANSISGLIRHTQNKFVQWKLAPVFLFATLIGARLGGYFSTISSPKTLKGLIGILLLITAVIFYLKRSKKEIMDPPPLSYTRMGVIFLGSFLISIVAAALGIGGGAFMIPLIYYAGHLPVKMVVGSSALFTFFVAINATLYYITEPTLTNNNYWMVGNVAFKIAIPVMISGMIGAQIGAGLLKKISPELVKYFFIVLLFLAGGKLIL